MTIRSRRISTRIRELSQSEGGEEKEPSPLRDVLIREERHEIHRWKETVEIRPPNLLVPRQIASFINTQPLCKIAVSPKCDYIAVMSHRRTFQMFRVEENEKIVPESSVQILEDSCAEYCLFEFAASGTLLLSTRSDSSIDVFDRLSEHCYTILPSVDVSTPDLTSAISSLSSYSLAAQEDKFTDYLAALHFNCTLSAYKMGRSSYFKLFTIQLTSPLTGLCRLLPSHGMILVSTHYRVGTPMDPPGGMASYRLIQGTPHVVPVVAPLYEQDWLSSLSARLPFTAFAYVCSMSVDSKESKCVCVSSTGDVFLFSLPSLNLISSLLPPPSPNAPRPRVAEFVHDEEIGVLFTSGILIRCPPEPEKFMEIIASGENAPVVDTFSGRTQMVVAAPRELFLLESTGDPEVSISSQRSSLAARLFLLTIWRSLKQMIGMAVGEAAMPLQQATQLLPLDLTIWHDPTVTLEELLERTLREGDFEKARQLAVKYPDIPSDTVYKRQWLDLCGKGKLTAEDVKDVLGRVKDISWKADKCLHTACESLPVQRELVAEGSRLPAALPLHLQLLHHGRLLSVMDDVQLYVEMKDQTLFNVAQGLAERGALVPLERLLTSNWTVLGKRALDILGLIPSSIAPSRYSVVLPKENGELTTPTSTNSYVEELDKLRNGEGRKEVERLDGTSEDISRELEEEETKEGKGKKQKRKRWTDMAEWAKWRSRNIEAETGMVPFAIQIIELCKERGVKGLEEECVRWKQFDLFIRITHSIDASLDFFLSAKIQLLTNHFATLSDDALISSLSSIVSLMEWHSPDTFLPPLADLITNRTLTSTRLLQKLYDERPELLEEQMMLEALSSLTVTGDALMTELRPLPLPPKLMKALRELHKKGVHPTFGRLWESQTDASKARAILAQLVSSPSKSMPEWREAADDVMSLCHLVYDELLSEEEALEMVAERFVLDEDAAVDSVSLCALLTLGEEGKEGGEWRGRKRLPQLKSAQLLLRMANSFVASAVSGVDTQLTRARLLAEAAKTVCPKESSNLIRSLDIIALAAELRSGRLPVHIVHADAVILLDEIIGIADNYKKGRRCARLAQLLRVDTPVASTYAKCALHAVERNDEATAAGYIKEICAARHLPVVHTLCMKLLSTPLLPHLRGDIEACAIANASEEELEEVLREISVSYPRVLPSSQSQSQSGSEIGEDTVDEEDERWSIPLPTTCPLDPCYIRVEHEEAGRSNDWMEGEEEEEERREDNRRRVIRSRGLPSERRVVDAARVLGAESASAAIAMGILCPNDQWTGDEKIKSYVSALRYFLPHLNSSLVQKIPPKKLIERAIAMDEKSTALDRLETYSCDRVRFVEDADYRMGTIEGMVMNEQDSQAWSDALELAEKFNVDRVRVHLASLENILSASLPSSEAREIIAKRKHADVLMTNPERLHSALRKNVLPLVTEDDAFLLYLEQFAPGSTEATMLPLLQYFRSLGITGLAVLLKDESKLTKILQEKIQLEDVQKVVNWLKEIPGTSASCEAAARVLMGEKVDPMRFIPLLSSPSMLIELLGDVSETLKEDMEWLLSHEEALNEEYTRELRKYRDELIRSEEEKEMSEERDDLFNAFLPNPIQHSNSESGLTQRRRGN